MPCRALPAALWCVLLLGACSVDLPEDTFACTDDSDCPDGWRCRVAGYCFRTPDGDADGGRGDAATDAGPRDAGAPVDAAVDAAADGGPPPCTTMLPFTFGAPTSTDVFAANTTAAYLSPDGLHLVSDDESGIVVKEVTRGTLMLGGMWSAPFIHRVNADLFPHLIAGNLGLFSCHGGGLHCFYRTRAAVPDGFPGAHDVAYAESSTGGGPYAPGGEAFGPYDTTYNSCFTPRPDARDLALCSRRMTAADPAPENTDLDIWLATSLDGSGNPRLGYRIVERVEVAARRGPDEKPQWLSDDGNLLIYTANYPDLATRRLYATSRPSRGEPFCAPVELDLLTEGQSAESFTLPSVGAVLGGSADGYVVFRSGGGAPEAAWFSVSSP
jgi:hypothetical protein